MRSKIVSFTDLTHSTPGPHVSLPRLQAQICLKIQKRTHRHTFIVVSVQRKISSTAKYTQQPHFFPYTFLRHANFDVRACLPVSLSFSTRTHTYTHAHAYTKADACTRTRRNAEPTSHLSKLSADPVVTNRPTRDTLKISKQSPPPPKKRKERCPHLFKQLVPRLLELFDSQLG